MAITRSQTGLDVFKRIKHYLAPPVFANDEEKTRSASLLNVIAFSFLVAALLCIPLLSAERLPYIGLALIVILTTWLAMRRGYVRTASIALVAGIFLVLVISVFTGGGVRAPSYSGFFALILLAGLLLGWKAAVGTALLSILYGAILLQADSHSLLPELFNYSSNAYLIINGVLFIMTGAFFILAHQRLEDALRRVKRELDERKHAEEDLLQFRKVMDESNDAIFIIDLETSRYIDFNRTACERLGYSREELSHLGVINIAQHITTMEIWRERTALIRETGGLLFETAYRRKDGTIFPVEVSARMLGYGMETVMVAVARDITQRKWVEEEREKLIDELEIKNKESETLHESLASIVGTFEFSEIIQRILDQIRRVIPYDTASVWRVEGNEQYIIAGVDLAPEIEIPGTTLVVDEDNSAFPLITGELPYILNNNVQEELQDFQEPPHNYVQSWLAIPLKTRGRIIGLIALDGRRKDQFNEHHTELAVIFANQLAIALENAGLFSDLQNELEERRRLIAELELKNAESETLRESAAIVAATLDKSEAIDRILEQLEKVVHFDSASVQLISGNTLEMVSARGFELNTAEMENHFELNENEPAYPVLQEKVPYALYEDIQLCVPAFHEPPHNRIHSWLAVPLKVKGSMIGIIALDGYRVGQFSERDVQLAVTYANQVAIALENARLFSDLQVELGARKNLISALESKNAELERFTYTVSHDLKSPLFTIRGFLGYLEKDALSGNQDRLKKDIQRIADATDKMQQLLNDLLELSRIGRLMNEPQEVYSEELIYGVLDLLHGQIQERGVKVLVQSGMPHLYGDRQRLAEVIQNLVDNAIKFMGNQTDPQVEIGMEGEENGMPIFFVRDNGIGILEEHHERVFGLFNKLDPRSEGTGIGLSLVKRIIEFHGGRIWVRSEAGKGSTFRFTLPPVRTMPAQPHADSVI
ncbi:MAG TPA: GAF domain-containing protein [Anaerolineales bacterium]